MYLKTSEVTSISWSANLAKFFLGINILNFFTTIRITYMSMYLFEVNLLRTQKHAWKMESLRIASHACTKKSMLRKETVTMITMMKRRVMMTGTGMMRWEDS